MPSSLWETPVQQINIKLDHHGSPYPSHNFIRISRRPNIPLILKFILNHAFVPTTPTSIPILNFGDKHFKLEGSLGQEWSAEVSISSSESGTIKYFILDGDKQGNAGHVQIPPLLQTKEGNLLTADQIILQTIVSKWMGYLNEWDIHLNGSIEAGYNMIHFTPLQKRGHSNSPYSISDHLSFSPDIIQDSDPVDSEKLDILVSEKIQSMFERGLFSMTDVVWNHCACDSPWLEQHPEAAYNLINSPHLIKAFELDECILRFSADLERYGLSSDLQSENQVIELLNVFRQQVLPQETLWEYFVINVNVAVNELEEVFRRKSVMSPTFEKKDQRPTINNIREAIINDGSYLRNALRMKTELVTEYFRSSIDEYRDCPNESDRSIILSRSLGKYRQMLDEINYEKYQEYDGLVERIIENLKNRMIYERIVSHGPKMGPISATSPLVPTYFTRLGTNAFANNGWIWNADPMINFADAPGLSYFSREIIVWGDCVKLRYGESPADCPWLWNYMKEYTEKMARIFHGFRIDNCHSTPINVAKYLLNCARNIRPNIYVCAELFTGSEEKDLLFVTELGLHSLIREAMVAWNVEELARTCTKYGGHAYGALIGVREGYSLQPHPLFMDCTHDNEMPSQKRTPHDSLSNAAVVAFSGCAIGSCKGYDDLVPKHLNIVNETLKYPLPNFKEGLWNIKKYFHDFHQKIVEEGLTELKVMVMKDLLIISRNNPFTLNGLIAVIKTAFTIPEEEIEYFPIDLGRFEVKILMKSGLLTNGNIKQDNGYFPRIESRVEIIKDHMNSSEICLVKNTEGTMTSLKINRMYPGNVLILRTGRLFQLPIPLVERPWMSEILNLISQLELEDLNYLLFRSKPEEMDSAGIGTYEIPGYGPLAYAGLNGFYHVISEEDSTATPALIQNIMEGDWALEYISSRLSRSKSAHLRELGEKFGIFLGMVSLLPANAKPRIVFDFIAIIHSNAVERACKIMELSKDTSPFIRSLALTAVELLGVVPSTGLHPLDNSTLALSAGLPHFSTHHMRCWGRDIFISLPGLLLRNGLWSTARNHLLAFAECCFKGLIPNLLDAGRRPRYNARDATWWFLRSLRLYCQKSPEGKAILNEQVPLRFPNDIYVDFEDPSIYSRSVPLKEIVKRILYQHANGIHFREWNAGPLLDSVMSDHGFDIDIYVDWNTGFIHGGNQFNCGTWMDKMGESSMAGNRGIPATPRDGAAVELTALLYDTLCWVVEEDEEMFFERGEMILADGRRVELAEWKRMIKANFEKYYLVPVEGGDKQDHFYKIKREYVVHKGEVYYKDTVGASDERCDYQLRPNAALAMHIAPDLFNREHAKSALHTMERHLSGPLGMKTLSPLDPCYRPYYDNSLDCPDASIARGFNYHQGPEWLWPLGFYLSAWHHFNNDSTMKGDELEHLIMKRLQPHNVMIQKSAYGGLVELTNEDGMPCRDSCLTQAWSSATLLEFLQNL